MTFQARILAIAMIGLAITVPMPAFAGGTLDEHDHEHDEGDNTKGPYGFVKDSRGAVVPEAIVTVDIENRGQLVTQTNILGAYKIPTYGIEIRPEDVKISCRKEGYKQVRVMQRLSMGPFDPKQGFEVECTLQKQ